MVHVRYTCGTRVVKKAVVLLDHTRIRQRGPDRTETETPEVKCRRQEVPQVSTRYVVDTTTEDTVHES